MPSIVLSHIVLFSYQALIRVMWIKAHLALHRHRTSRACEASLSSAPTQFKAPSSPSKKGLDESGLLSTKSLPDELDASSSTPTSLLSCLPDHSTLSEADFWLQQLDDALAHSTTMILVPHYSCASM